VAERERRERRRARFIEYGVLSMEYRGWRKGLTEGEGVVIGMI